MEPKCKAWAGSLNWLKSKTRKSIAKVAPSISRRPLSQILISSLCTSAYLPYSLLSPKKPRFSRSVCTRSPQPRPRILSLLRHLVETSKSFWVPVSNSHKSESVGQAWIKREQLGHGCAQWAALHGSHATNLVRISFAGRKRAMRTGCRWWGV